jgi:CBS domain-containing protein
VSRVKVRAIYRPWVVTADGGEQLAAVATRMQDNQVGSVVVTVGGRLAGIVTERDLTRAIAEGADPEVATAAEYMTETLASIDPDADVRDVVEALLELQCRHLPVTDGGTLVGMVSVRDLLGTVVRLA